MKQEEIAQNRFIDVNGDSWFSSNLFDLSLRDFCINQINYLNDDRFETFDIIIKLKEPKEKEILEASRAFKGIPF